MSLTRPIPVEAMPIIRGIRASAPCPSSLQNFSLDIGIGFGKGPDYFQAWFEEQTDEQETIRAIWGITAPPVQLPAQEQEPHPLLDHARNEMIRAGLFDKGSDYEGLLARSVMDMLKAHIKAGHSGASHEQALEIFNILVRYKPLTPITSDPSEWNDVSDVSGKPS